MIFVWGYILVSVILLAIIFVRNKDLFNQLINIVDISQERETIKPILFYPFIFFVAIIMILLLGLLICASPYLFYKHIINNTNLDDVQEEDYSLSEPRPYIPYYDILFFSLVGELKMEHPLVQKLINNYERFNQVAFPIVFDYKIAEKYLFTKSYRHSLEEANIALYIFDVRVYQDAHFEETFYQSHHFEETPPSSFLNSNTNFSRPSRHLDASASALSYLLGIPIDGLNKLILINKNDLNTLKIIPLDHKLIELDFTDLNSIIAPEVVLDEPFHNYVAQFLSLRWTKSKMEKNKPIKQCAEKIRTQLYQRYKIEDPSIFNILKLAELGPKSWEVLYRLRSPTEEEEKIMPIIFSKSHDELLSIYPNLDESDFEYIKRTAVERKLNELSKLEGLEYESKIFLKSANTVYSMLILEEEMEEMDYSPVAIGYTKFFEKEINVSIVQSIRKDLGILMPTYFNKYYPSNEIYEIKINDVFKVDYNMKNMKTGSYLAPGLGQTFRALEIEINKIDGDKNKLNELLYKGRKLNNIRNRAAHPELIDKEDVDNIRDILIKLYLYRIFDELINTKKKLSN